jgi:tetratricopeptide (TPR) repeat protein
MWSSLGHSRARLCAALCVGTLACCGVSPVCAQAAPAEAATAAAPTQADEDREARFLFEAGRTAYDAGRYREALAHFQGAYDLSLRPQLLYNVGQAADRLRQDEVALDAFERYLSALPVADNRPAV